MEREAFRQRMQQYKQARESNPQLKYWDWKKYADGGEVRDNTYVAPVYKEQVFIPATGAQKIKNDYQYKYGSKSPYKGGELEIVSPEFDALTGIRGMLNSLSKINTLTKELNKNIDISTLNNQLPNGIKPTQKDFRIKIDNAVTPSQEITNHEINHFNQYIHQDSPSWNKSELDKITKQFKGKLRDKNPIDPENTSYFMNWMEQNAYGINMLDRLKELNIKPTKQNILKYLKSLPDTDSIKKAALQFKNLDDYIKWLNTMPLADNGNINEIENYNFA